MKAPTLLFLAWPGLIVTYAQTDGTATSSSSPSTATPNLFFININALTTCDQATITWVSSGDSGHPDMSLAITNQALDNDDCTPSLPPQSLSDTDSILTRRSVPDHLTSTDADGDSDSSSSGTIMMLISTSIVPSSHTYTWPQVTVSQGCYAFAANISGFTMQNSSPFWVQNGTDTSCLVAVPPVSSSSSSTTMSMSTSSSSSSSSAQNTSAVTLPVGDTSGSHVNKAAIAGGVIGGVVVLVALVSALVLYRYSRSSQSRRFNGGIMGKWGNLGSFDSASKSKSSPARARKTKSKMYDHHGGVGLAGLGLGLADPQTRHTHNSRHDSQADSIGPINVLADSRPTQTSSQEDSYYSPYDEKYMRSPFSDSGHGSEEMGMVPIGYEPTSSPSAAGATAGHNTKHSSMGSSTYSYTQNSNYSRPRSQTPKSTPSPQTFPESPRNLSSVTIESRPTDTSEVVAGGSVPVTPTARKTPRKPVPTYNLSDPALSHPTRSADVPSDVRDSDSDVGLAHKNSFGSFKQIHYLIPDMPPLQRDT